MSNSNDSITTVTLGNQILRINALHGGIAEYVINGQPVIFGYSDLKHSESSQGAILSPFPGRVRKGEFKFEDKLYQLKCYHLDAFGNELHFCVDKESWTVKALPVEKDTQRIIHASLLFKGTEEPTKSKYNFPFDLSFNIQYVLDETLGLIVRSIVKNVSSTSNAPLGFGFHPYFTLPCDEDKHPRIDEMVLKLPANKMVEFADNMEPTGKLIDLKGALDSNDDKQLKQYEPYVRLVDPKNETIIDQSKYDHCFTDLQFNEKNTAESFLYWKDSKKYGTYKLKVWQDASSYPYIQVYSYDKSKFGTERRAIAIEPESCCGFAANYPEMLNLLSLKPNEEFKASWGCSLSS